MSGQAMEEVVSNMSKPASKADVNSLQTQIDSLEKKVEELESFKIKANLRIQEYEKEKWGVKHKPKHKKGEEVTFTIGVKELGYFEMPVVGVIVDNDFNISDDESGPFFRNCLVEFEQADMKHQVKVPEWKIGRKLTD